MNHRIFLDAKKEYSEVNWIISPSRAPSRVWLSVPKSVAQKISWCIRPGDQVKTGQIIAEPTSPDAVFIHASLSGRIQKIFEARHALGGVVPAVEIVAETREDAFRVENVDPQLGQTLSRNQKLELFRSCGLVTLDDREEPLNARLQKEQYTKEDALLINGCEPEPYSSSQASLILSHPLEILRGAEKIREITGAGKIILLLDAHRAEAVELVRSKIYFLKWAHVEVIQTSAGYPSGPSQIQALLNSKKLPAFRNYAIYNAFTIYAAYEALAYHKPLIERPITVAGECLAESKNIWARLGSLAEDLLKSGKGLLREPQKLVVGGPMTGIAQSDALFPVSVSTSSLLALPKEVAVDHSAQPCIRCGKCVEVCPEKISPALISIAWENEDFDAVKLFGAEKCSECGNCAYVCPSHRPLTEWLQQIKTVFTSPDILESTKTPYVEAVVSERT